MILLFTDFGIGSPYIGQMKAVICQYAPDALDSLDANIIELISDAPAFNTQASAYLLAAYINEFPVGSIFLGVVDPGVGSSRRGIIMSADDRWFVGPDNGLFNVVSARSERVKYWEIDWVPEKLSNTFHGRDLFAPVAAKLALGEPPPGILLDQHQLYETIWPEDLPECIYIDSFGNIMTGLRANKIPEDAQLRVRHSVCSRQTTFSDVPAGELFWYENANGLVEIAINKGSAAKELNIRLGDPVLIL